MQSEHTRVNEDIEASDAYSDAEFEDEDDEIHHPPQVAVLRIQARQRGRVARRELEQHNNAARTVQARQRGRVAQREFAEQRVAATRIQAMQRGKADRRQHQRLVQEESAATRIQARRRGVQGRRAADEMRHVQGLDVASEVGSEDERDAQSQVVAARVAAAEAGIAVDGTPGGVLDAVKVCHRRCSAHHFSSERSKATLLTNGFTPAA
jgi:curved DNA-binding protein CbpA